MNHRGLTSRLLTLKVRLFGPIYEGYLLHLFSYWGNDLQEISGHFGVILARDENGSLVVKDVDPDEWNREVERFNAEQEKEWGAKMNVFQEGDE